MDCEHLETIAEILYHKTKTLNNLGLFHGLTGVVIFFFHYAQYKQNSDFEDFAMSLIVKILHQVSDNFQIDYYAHIAETGICIQYLLKNCFIEGKSNEVLEDFDEILSQYVICEEHIDGNTLNETGRYFISRISEKDEPIDIPIRLAHKIILIHIVDIIDAVPMSSNELKIFYNLLLQIDQLNIYPTKVQQLLKRINYENHYMKEQHSVNMQHKKISDIYHGLFEQSNVEFKKQCDRLSPGLYGLSGIGLYVLSLIDNKHKIWHSLL